MKLLEIRTDTLPKHIKDAIEHQIRVNGRFEISELPKYIREELESILKSSETTIEDHSNELPAMLKSMSVVTSGVVDGLRIYNELSKSLIVTFHNEQAKREGLEMFNACAEFVRQWNKMDLEHSECIQLDTKH